MLPNNYYVLRLHHRIVRDKRLSTHVGLIARAFGAKGYIYSGEKDTILEKSITEINKNFNQKFECTYWDDWMANLKFLSKTNTIFVHLTMYGTPIQDVQENIFQEFDTGKNIIFIVGGAKVPTIIYKISKYNISVTNQPHSEAGALAVTLDRIFKNAINN